MLNFSTRFRFAIQGQKSFNNVKLQSKPESSLQKSMKLITLLRDMCSFSFFFFLQGKFGLSCNLFSL